ncbi:hypothetical protein CBL_05131, partial [Carabus blaptoides fortunei]
MVLVYGEAGRNLDNAVALYAQRFRDRIPSRASFYRTVKKFTTDGSIQPKKRTRRTAVTDENNTIALLAAVAHNPHNSTLDGQMYRDILENELPTLLEDLSIEVRQNMWFQHDGCPAHYSMLAREVLDRDFNGLWI